MIGMIGWIIAGAFVVGLLSLVFWGAFRDRRRGDKAIDLIAHRVTTDRNDTGGMGQL